jgi:signal transduction histidine kinase
MDNIDLVFKITKKFTSKDPFDKICQEVIEAIVKDFSLNQGALFILDNEKKNLYPYSVSLNRKASYIIKKLPMEIQQMNISLKDSSNLVVKSLLVKQVIINNDFEMFTPPQVKYMAKYVQSFAGIKTAASIPIIHEEEVLGVFVVTKSKNTFDTNEISSLKVFANIAGIAIKNAKLEMELQLKVDELKNSLLFKTELLDTVSHELKTPAVIVKNSLSMIQNYEDNEDYLHYAKQASIRQIMLINNLLNTSIIDHGMMYLEKEDFDINELIARIAMELEIFILKKNVKIELSFDHKRILNADKQKISQVIYNLLYNAVKFTGKGKIKISSKFYNNYLMISVEDTGIGISKINKSKLFKKYYSFNKKNLKDNFGTGLGLYIVKNIVDSHAGTIDVKSKIKVGSTFAFTIPVD